MADAMAALRTYILDQSSVNDLIAQRLYLGRRKQGALLPNAVIKRTSESHDHLLSGRSGIVQTRFQIECFSDRHSGTTGAASIAEAIYQCDVDTLKGETNGVNFRGVTVEDGRREYDYEDTEGGDAQTYVCQFDLMVTYLEA
jgi:hypothetical protein